MIEEAGLVLVSYEFWKGAVRRKRNDSGEVSKFVIRFVVLMRCTNARCPELQGCVEFSLKFASDRVAIAK